MINTNGKSKDTEDDDFDRKVLEVIVIDDDDDCQEVAAQSEAKEEDFLDVLLRSSDNVRIGNEMLLKAVRTFEQ